MLTIGNLQLVFIPEQNASNKNTVQQKFPTTANKTLIMTPPKACSLDLYQPQ